MEDKQVEEICKTIWHATIFITVAIFLHGCLFGH
jgi:hypothetical protein